MREPGGKTTFEALFADPDDSPRIIECTRILLEGGADPLRVAYSNPANFQLPRYTELSESTKTAIQDLMRPYAAPYLE